MSMQLLQGSSSSITQKAESVCNLQRIVRMVPRYTLGASRGLLLVFVRYSLQLLLPSQLLHHQVFLLAFDPVDIDSCNTKTC